MAELAGRFKRILPEKRRRRVRHGADEIVEVEQGAALARLVSYALPSEAPVRPYCLPMTEPNTSKSGKAASAPPTYDELMAPTIEALRALGGSATIDELDDRVKRDLQLPEDVLQIPHDPERPDRGEVSYRMAWARTYLKKAGLIENSERGVWALTSRGRDAKRINGREIAREVGRGYKTRPAGEAVQGSAGAVDPIETEQDVGGWRDQLLREIGALSSDAFERLAQRLLRESGFVEVEVTGRSGDGGIDGIGILRLQGLLSFRVLFQCKRWASSVPAKEIRDFRGAMVGRSDKGFFITTGTFSPKAREEATRDGAPAIDLIDADALVELMKRLRLGVSVEQVEKVTINSNWLRGL